MMRESLNRRTLLTRGAIGVASSALGALGLSRLTGDPAGADPDTAPAPDRPPARAASGLPADGSGTSSEPALTVLAYHTIPSRSGFAAEMDWLQSWNYDFVTPDQVASALAGQSSLPAKPLLLTFDDGYQSQYDHAWPELADRGLAATIYVCTGWVDGHISESEGAFMEPRPATWSQLRTMHESGLVQVQSHSMSHRRQTHLTTATVRDEFLGSKKRIERQVPGAQVAHMAYPFGSWSNAVRQVLAEAGCRTARTMTISGPGYGFFSLATRSSDPLALPCAGGSFRDILAVNYFHTVVSNDQLCPNFGFEAGAVGWDLGRGFAVADGVAAVQGRRSLEAQAARQPSSAQAHLPIPVRPGATVTGSAAIMTIGLVPSAVASLCLELTAVDGVTPLGAPVVASTRGTATGDWDHVDWSLALPADCGFIRPVCALDPAGSTEGRAYWDDISISAPTPDPRTTG